jgi:hypothetical protein
MFHIFRNSPLGRENLLQSIYFCKKLKDLAITIYVPTATQCLMYFENSVVTLDLDESYTCYPETADQHIDALMADTGLPYEIFETAIFTSGALPEIPTNWDVMACPRVISEQSSRIGLGHVGPKVRDIVKHGCFPVFIPCTCYKPWNSVAAFFGCSDLGLSAVRQAVSVAERSGVPLTMYTQLNGTTRESCEQKIAEAGLDRTLQKPNRRWIFFEFGTLEENLYEVPFDSLVVVGAAGESLVRELVFGSKLETIQKTLPNPILVVGPECKKTV